MTLAGALAALQGQGRIRSWFRPGMLVQVPSMAIPIYARLHDDGRVAESEPVPGRWEPQVDDPATAGCLLALLREASGRPGLTPLLTPAGTWALVEADPYWGWRFWAEPHTFYPTEGDALLEALVALAGGRP